MQPTAFLQIAYECTERVPRNCMHIAHALHMPQQGLHGCYAEVSTFIEEVGTEASNPTHSACRPAQFACAPM